MADVGRGYVLLGYVRLGHRSPRCRWQTAAAQARDAYRSVLDEPTSRLHLATSSGCSAGRVRYGKAVPFEMALRRDGDPAALFASSERVRRELGWRPRFEELDVIVETAWRWRVAHPRGYATVTA